MPSLNIMIFNKDLVPDFQPVSNRLRSVIYTFTNSFSPLSICSCMSSFEVVKTGFCMHMINVCFLPYADSSPQGKV